MTLGAVHGVCVPDRVASVTAIAVSPCRCDLKLVVVCIFVSSEPRADNAVTVKTGVGQVAATPCCAAD